LTNYPAAIDELEKRELLLPSDPAEIKRIYSDLHRAFQEGDAKGYWLKQLDSAHHRLSLDEYPYTYAGLYAGWR
jgi:hypothetical protein